MRTLTNDRFAPITSSPGFLKLPFHSGVDHFVAWHRRLHPRVDVKFVEGFPECLRLLEPLTVTCAPRVALVEVKGGWTAYFDCHWHGTDTGSPIGYLPIQAHCEGISIATIPHTLTPDGRHGRRGARTFTLYADHDVAWLNVVRSISLVYEARWRFDTLGDPLPFEEVEKYSSRLSRDKFTSAMIERYCKALGLDVFNESAYGPRAAIITSAVGCGPNSIRGSLEDCQREYPIAPDEADRMPG